MGIGKHGIGYWIIYRCKESKISYQPLCVHSVSIFSVILSI